MPRPLLSPGLALFCRPAVSTSILRHFPALEPSSTIPLPPALESSLLAPEITAFHSILTQFETSSAQLPEDFLVFLGPSRLRHKLLVRALFQAHPQLSQQQGLPLSDLRRYLHTDFGPQLKLILSQERLLMNSELTPFVEQLRDRFDRLGQEHDSKHSHTETRMSLLFLAFNISLFSLLFFLTYFVWDWEVVEPISYLIVVTSNFIWLLLLLRKNRVQGNQYDFFMKRSLKHVSINRAAYALNRKRFFRFYYEFQDLNSHLTDSTI